MEKLYLVESLEKLQENPKKVVDLKTILVVVSTLSIIGYSLVVILFIKNSSLNENIKLSNSQLEKAKAENSQFEKELIFYKNTDLAKEVEILQLKLNNAEKNLKSTESQLNSTQNQLKNLQTNIAKIKPYLDVIDAIESLLSEGPKENNVSNVNSKVSTLGDSEVSDQWARAKASIDLEKSSWSGSEISATVSLITSKILSLII
ncbi:hypothetical protein A3A75_04315 [Candidatus Woesebacteria bacterium RIFCSPLOWO2_01_FULL_39_10]|uniref:Uncharacterized protein n=1 Tax=Candidatus Woesebacteria bacterium RIFCSPLOWO2_01_FULL_39_10 TaxID=1802516 RepID=A0A1F8B483_9BACT|nr:MAG: hypothetical protein A3A75_04315 [Candidatus Woesebacteria bacterium RIFCSPLOWO2_01_FULL_39_10]